MLNPMTAWITTNWKILQEMGISGHRTCLLRNLYAGQEATVRTEHGSTDWFQIGKGVRQGCILSPCLFNFHAEYIMWNARLDEAQAGIKIARGNINNLRYAHDTKDPLDESERAEWKSWLQTKHSKNEDYDIWSHQFISVQLLHHVWLFNPINCCTPGFPVHHQCLDLAQTCVHLVGDAIQPSHPLSSPSSPAFSLFQLLSGSFSVPSLHGK